MIPETGNRREFKHWVLNELQMQMCNGCHRPFLPGAGVEEQFCPMCAHILTEVLIDINSPENWVEMDWTALGINGAGE